VECLQKMRNAVLDHLNNYAESVCIDCGFVQRDCRCADAIRRHSGSKMTFLGNAVSVKDANMQTDPMVVVGMQQKVNAPGFSVVVPQNFYLTPDVKLPLTMGPHNALTVPPHVSSVHVNSLTPGVINLPPTITFPAGCPSSFVNPLTLSTSVGVQPGVSLLRPPMVGGVNLPSSSSIVIQAPASTGSTSDDAVSAGRKRKLEDDARDVSVAHASVQTTGKSYVKKMKVQLGNFSASDFKVIGINSNTPNSQRVTSDLATAAGVQPSEKTGAAAPNTSTTASSGADNSGTKKDVETAMERKYTAVWKLLEDSSDDECVPDKPESVSQDVVESAATEKNSASLQMPEDGVASSSSEPISTPTASQPANEESSGEKGSVAATEDKSDTIQHRDDDSGEEEVDSKLVIDSHVDDDAQQSERENEPSFSQQANNWEFRNGMKESELPDDEKEVHESGNGVEQPMAKTGGDNDGKPSAVAEGNPSAAANDVDKCVPMGDDSDTSQLLDSSAPALTGASAAETVTDIVPDTAGSAKPESAAPKPRRVYGKFEYAPTGEHILRCLVPKCSQTFDRKLAADVHNHVHPGFEHGVEGKEGQTYLQCHQCEFQAPFYHWYDLLRHMRQKHDICLVDGAAAHTCEYCGLGFETKDLLVSHIDFHYSNRYKCIYCGLLLLTWGQVTYINVKNLSV